jgi:hypothetical protein
MKRPLRLETIPLSYWSKTARATLTGRNDRWRDDPESHSVITAGARRALQSAARDCVKRTGMCLIPARKFDLP